jgi:hypothetical protein
MTLSLRRSVTAAVGFVAAGWLLSACSNATTSEVGALGANELEPSTIAVETSSQYVTIINNAGKPIEDVQISIHPVGTAPPFTSTLRRMENGEKRDVSVGMFRSNDGTPFNTRAHRARQVTVTATDIVGKKHELTKPWR